MSGVARFDGNGNVQGNEDEDFVSGLDLNQSMNGTYEIPPVSNKWVRRNPAHVTATRDDRDLAGELYPSLRDSGGCEAYSFLAFCFRLLPLQWTVCDSRPASATRERIPST